MADVIDEGRETNGSAHGHPRPARLRRWLLLGLLAAGTPASAVPGEATSPPAASEPSERSVAESARARRAFTSDGTRLDWQPLIDGVDGTLWREASAPVSAGPTGTSPADRFPSVFHGTGFPTIERVVRLPEHRRRRWEPLISWSEPSGSTEGAPVALPHVRCMGLSPHAVARRAARVEGAVLELSLEHGVSASLVKALIAAESCFDHDAVSSAGAIGLMQLMPATAEWLGAGDPADLDANLRGGIRYLASLQERFGDVELALAAYNAGPGNVRRHGGIPPFAETRAYVRKVMAFHRRYVAATGMAVR